MWVKVCGVTNVDDAAAIAELGPDAIGLNFFSGSKRCVDCTTAAEIVSLLPSGVEPVGVFVNHSPQEITTICRACGINTVQLHGDEPPETARELEPFDIIRAARIGSGGLADLQRQLEQFRELGVELRGCLVDAYVAGTYGGTGHCAPWELLASEWKRAAWPPLILAGGLNPENVAAAVRDVFPWGVDVASGVEASPGQKDLDKVARFVAEARRAATQSNHDST